LTIATISRGAGQGFNLKTPKSDFAAGLPEGHDVLVVV